MTTKYTKYEKGKFKLFKKITLNKYCGTDKTKLNIYLSLKFLKLRKLIRYFFSI